MWQDPFQVFLFVAFPGAVGLVAFFYLLSHPELLSSKSKWRGGDQRLVAPPPQPAATSPATPAQGLATTQTDSKDMLRAATQQAKIEAIASLMIASRSKPISGELGKLRALSEVFGVKPGGGNERYLALSSALDQELEKRLVAAAGPKYPPLTEEQKAERQALGLESSAT